MPHLPEPHRVFRGLSMYATQTCARSVVLINVPHRAYVEEIWPLGDAPCDAFIFSTHSPVVRPVFEEPLATATTHLPHAMNMAVAFAQQ